VKTGLARIESNHQHGEKNHVGGKEEKDEKANAVKEFARAPAFIFPVVVSAAAPAAGRPTVHGRLSADSRFSPFRFRGCWRKNGRHPEPLWK
jgi:hypothetical protein